MPDQIIVFGEFKVKDGSTVLKYTGFSVPNQKDPTYPMLADTLLATIKEGIDGMREVFREYAERNYLKFVGIKRVEHQKDRGYLVKDEIDLDQRVADEKARLKEKGLLPESKPVEKHVSEKGLEMMEEVAKRINHTKSPFSGLTEV